MMIAGVIFSTTYAEPGHRPSLTAVQYLEVTSTRLDTQITITLKREIPYRLEPAEGDVFSLDLDHAHWAVSKAFPLIPNDGRVRSIEKGQLFSTTRIVISLEEGMEYEVQTLEAPFRIVVVVIEKKIPSSPVLP